MESCGQVAVQASGVLRNLAVPMHNASHFLHAGALGALRAACSALSGQVEVVLNVGRILSKLSLHEGCQAAIAADTAYAPLLVRKRGTRVWGLPKAGGGSLVDETWLASLNGYRKPPDSQGKGCGSCTVCLALWTWRPNAVGLLLPLGSLQVSRLPGWH